MTKEEMLALLQKAIESGNVKEMISKIVEEKVGKTSEQIRAAGEADRLRRERDAELAVERAVAHANTRAHKAYFNRYAAECKADHAKGAGLLTARFIRASIVSKLDQIPIEEVLKGWGDEALLPTFAEVRAQQKLMSVASSSAGGFLVPEEQAREIIELLRPVEVIASLPGVRRLPLRGPLPMPRATGSSTAYFTGEGANTTPSQPSFDQPVMQPHELNAATILTSKLIALADPAVDAYVRDDLVQVLALRKDLAYIRGDGTANTPKGIKNQIAASQSNNQSGTALANIVADLYTAIEAVEGNNHLMNFGAWVMTTRTKNGLAQLLDSNGNFVFKQDIASGMLLGYPFRTTNQIPKTLGSGDDTEVYFVRGDDIVEGVGPDMSVTVTDGPAYYDGSAVQSGWSRNEIGVKATMSCDLLLRHNTGAAVIEAVDFDA